MAGKLDPMFNGTGMVTTLFLGKLGLSFAVAQAVAIQPDGKILAVGWSGDGPLAPDDFSLARYNPNGSLDPTFGAKGQQVTDFGPNGSNDVGYALAIQPDGRIVMAGYSGDFGLARYDTDGNLDRKFGNQGTLTTDFFGGDDFATGVAIQRDGKIVAAGTSIHKGTAAFALARYEPNGALDLNFGNQGLAITPPGWDARGFAIAIQRDGRIVVAGAYYTTGSSEFAVVRFNTDGTLDQNFGAGGKVTTSLFFGAWSEAHAVAIQRNGRIVVAGWAIYPYGPHWFALARYRRDGSLDKSFGNGGTVLTDIRASAEANALAIQSDGKIVAAGRSWAVFPPQGFPEYDFALACYNPDGTLDPLFGAGGKVTTTVNDNANPTLTNQAWGVAIQADGKIVAVGSVESALAQQGASNVYFAVARYS